MHCIFSQPFVVFIAYWYFVSIPVSDYHAYHVICLYIAPCFYYSVHGFIEDVLFLSIFSYITCSIWYRYYILILPVSKKLFISCSLFCVLWYHVILSQLSALEADARTYDKRTPGGLHSYERGLCPQGVDVFHFHDTGNF